LSIKELEIVIWGLCCEINYYHLSVGPSQVKMTSSLERLYLQKFWPSVKTWITWAKVRYPLPIIFNSIKRFVSKKYIDRHWLHRVLGNFRYDISKKSTNIHDLKLFGEFEVCEESAIAKVRQKAWTKCGLEVVKFQGKDLKLIYIQLKRKSLEVQSCVNLLKIHKKHE
jgi:hypothetical protein